MKSYRIPAWSYWITLIFIIVCIGVGFWQILYFSSQIVNLVIGLALLATAIWFISKMVVEIRIQPKSLVKRFLLGNEQVLSGISKVNITNFNGIIMLDIYHGDNIVMTINPGYFTDDRKAMIAEMKSAGFLITDSTEKK